MKKLIGKLLCAIGRPDWQHTGSQVLAHRTTRFFRCDRCGKEDKVEHWTGW